jgi:hypothetical protein
MVSARRDHREGLSCPQDLGRRGHSQQGPQVSNVLWPPDIITGQNLQRDQMAGSRDAHPQLRQQVDRLGIGRRVALIKQLEVNILWDMDEMTLLTAGRLKAEHRVSLADAIIAAFAIRRHAVLMHKDPEFDALTGLLPMEALPYKLFVDKP